MNEYLKKEDVIKALKHSHGASDYLVDILTEIECVPTVDVVEVKHGKMNEYEVNDVDISENFIRIYWQGKKGFGTYDLIFEDGKIYAYSEYMDRNNDKALLRALLNIIADKVEVVD